MVFKASNKALGVRILIKLVAIKATAWDTIPFTEVLKTEITEATTLMVATSKVTVVLVD